MVVLENEYIRVSVKEKGAELVSLYQKERALEYMWEGDPVFWGKHSPVLFPIVGALKNDTYYFEGKAFSLPRHGFARDCVFEVQDQTATSVEFVLYNSPETEKLYPFQFAFSILYKLERSQLTVTYRVKNTGESGMWFSVGAHPAFRIPLLAGTDYEDYALAFNMPEYFDRWPITADGLIEAQPQKAEKETDLIPLSKSLFAKDALVFKHLRSNQINLKVNGEPAGLAFAFNGFPYLGIWAAKDADFVCLEPWCGIADAVHTTQQLTEKEGIQSLAAQSIFERSWSVTV